MNNPTSTFASNSNGLRKVDHSALRTNQAFIISILVIAFVLNAPILVVFVGAVMIIGTIFPKAGLFKLFYLTVLKPNKIVRTDVKIDNPEPHQFSQGLGGAFLAAASLGFLASSPVVGWVLTWIVIALASLNLFAGFCAGCFVYYQLNRLGVPGFDRAPITQ